MNADSKPKLEKNLIGDRRAPDPMLTFDFNMLHSPAADFRFKF